MRRLFFVLAAASAGCSLVVGLDGLAGQGAQVDAGPDSAASDADVLETETGPIHTDAGQALEAGADGGFCDTLGRMPDLCLDYDRGAALNTLGNVVEYGGGSVSLSGLGAVSPPMAMLTTTPALASGKGAGCQLRISMGMTPATVTLRFTATLTEKPASEATFSSITLDGKRGLSLILGPAGAHLQETVPIDGGTTGVNHPATGTVNWGQPITFVMSVGLKDTALVGSLSLDGVSVESNAPLDPRLTLGTPSVDLGWGYVGGVSAPRTAVIDNVVVDLGH